MSTARGSLAGGTHAATVSKTVGVASEIVFDLWADEDRRGAWLADDVLALRSASRPKSLRFDFGPDDSRVLVVLYPKAEHKTVVHVSNSGLDDEGTIAQRKAYWKSHLDALNRAAEQYRPM